MKKIIILVLAIMLVGCNNNNIEKIMRENEYVIIDVRTNDEYKSKHIKGAINIPYDELNNSLDKDKVIFVYCKSGGRSSIAYTKLTNMGYTVYDLGAFDTIDLPKE